MGTFGAYLEQRVLDHVFGSTGAWTASTSLYFGLCTTDVTSSGYEYSGKEPATTDYARVAITNTSSNFTAAETSGGVGVKYNAVAITFSAVTCSSWATVTYAFITATSSTNAPTIAWGALTTSKDVGVGDTASFAANAFKITLD